MKLFVNQNTTNENKQLQWEEFPVQSKYYFGTINKQDTKQNSPHQRVYSA